MSDDRHGPFFVRWNPSPPKTQAGFSRDGAERTIDELPEAIRFVMEELPEGSRGTAWIDATVGPSLLFEEIARRYTAARQ